MNAPLPVQENSSNPGDSGARPRNPRVNPRVLIADDHEIVRRGLRPLITAEEGWEICGEAADGLAAVAMAARLKPDVVVLDFGMPLVDGVEATRQIKKHRPETEVVAFTGRESEALVHQLFAAGALACVLKSEADEQLIPAIRALCHHEPYLGNRSARIVFERYMRGGGAPEPSAPAELSAREQETVRLLAAGGSNREVATHFGISVKTVETHRATIMHKLGFSAFSELVRYAVRSGLADP